MFWRWHSEYGYMETEKGQHVSQTEMLSQRLFNLTFWGDYGGDIVSRYHWYQAQEIAPNITDSVSAAYGRGLIIGDVGSAYPDELSNLIRFLAHFDPESAEYGGYPIYDESEFSEWEWKLKDDEMTTGWWAEYAQGELASWEGFGDWENTIVPEKHSDEWATLVWDYTRYHDDNYELGITVESYWEGADSLIVDGWDTEKVAEWLLTRYAEEITNAGNPEPLI